jgi:hypothetical protein
MMLLTNGSQRTARTLLQRQLKISSDVQCLNQIQLVSDKKCLRGESLMNHQPVHRAFHCAPPRIKFLPRRTAPIDGSTIERYWRQNIPSGTSRLKITMQ